MSEPIDPTDVFAGQAQSVCALCGRPCADDGGTDIDPLCPRCERDADKERLTDDL